MQKFKLEAILIDVIKFAMLWMLLSENGSIARINKKQSWSKSCWSTKMKISLYAYHTLILRLFWHWSHFVVICYYYIFVSLRTFKTTLNLLIVITWREVRIKRTTGVTNFVLAYRREKEWNTFVFVQTVPLFPFFIPITS